MLKVDPNINKDRENVAELHNEKNENNDEKAVAEPGTVLGVIYEQQMK